MAGMSFLRDRSPVTPKMTRLHGPAIRGSRLSRGSRSGLVHPTAADVAALIFLLARLDVVRVAGIIPGLLELLHGTRQGDQTRHPVGEMEAEHGAAAGGERGGVGARE